MKKPSRIVKATLATGVAGALVASMGIGSVAFAADKTPEPAPTDNAEAKAEEILKTLTLDEKLGQLIWTHVYGANANEVTEEQQKKNQNVFGQDVKTPAEAVKKWNLGGVLYFNWSGNIGSPADLEQIATLSNGLQDAAKATGKKIPLAISVDQEGGIVARLRHSITDFPGNMALGATRSEELAKKQAEINGRELRSVGINVDFAPTVDVNTNPQNPVIGVRSYSSNPELVSLLGAAQITGYQSQGVSATAKHFPGHGDTSTDSHSSLPVVAYGQETLDEHLKPFKAAIDAGVDMIMTAHVIVNAVDPDQPATLSKKVLTDLLRDKMGFKGIITTDAIDMEGAQLAVMSEQEKKDYENWKCKGTTSFNGGENTAPDKAEACVDLMKKIRSRVTVQAVKAGSDIVLNTYDVEASFNGLKNALKDGTLTQKHIDDSVKRVLTWKARRGVLDQKNVKPDEVTQHVRTAADQFVASQVDSKMVTLVKNDNNILPLKAGQKVLVTGSTYGNPEKLQPKLDALGFETKFETTAKLNPTEAEIAAQVKAAQDVDAIIYTSFKAYNQPEQAEAVKQLAATGKPVIVVATSVPYDSAALPSAVAVLNVYGNQDPNHDGAARALAGVINPTGQLPVAVPALADVPGSKALPYGYGLSYSSRNIVIPPRHAEKPAGDIFKDVTSDSAFAGEINFLKELGVTTGWADGTFRPLQPITREAMAAFLARIVRSHLNEDGKEKLDEMVSKEKTFTDTKGNPFEKDIMAIRALGLTTGWADGTYRPLAHINRDAMAAMLQRTCQIDTNLLVENICSSAVSNLKPIEKADQVFVDVPADSLFAKHIQWAKTAGITTGWADLTYRPLEPISREAMAAFLYRLQNNIVK
ncbi:hypothetical protein BK816_04130 [Boudabousia tangfeifanii]|uniref:beta-N-acetylhexosaminidase n=1 Tax=Boudabousia tangfeifanii TaxID=1912795 RepID=A0A1D9MJX1_9ACTO|nr:glycoside hydrolase family 3 N-terminal domain-containing protein [Boudabousia tangfeifanii]AOZ72582.1 hypothetical protein BK816_04130 [Boudabousia tangfeifanii]